VKAKSTTKPLVKDVKDVKAGKAKVSANTKKKPTKKQVEAVADDEENGEDDGMNEAVLDED